MFLQQTAAFGFIGVLAFSPFAAGQATAPNPTQRQIPAATVNDPNVPIFRVEVVGRTTKAVNYRHRSGATKINFAGTSLLPLSKGEAKVESKQGYIEVEVEFRNLQPATQYGPEFLTYILWAISPEGRAINLGEVLLNGTSSKLDVTTDLQSFGMIVTAEPYFAVSQPSDVVVMENSVRPDTLGKVEEVDAKYELLKRGFYSQNLQAANATQITDKKIPLELYEARNALLMARLAGADRYSSDTYQKAADQLQQAETYRQKKSGTKPITMTARAAVQTAEDARLISLQRQDEQRVAAEKAAQEARTAAANQAAAESATRAAQEADRRRVAEAESRLAARDKADADTARAAAEQARIQAEAARAAADQSAQRSAAERQQADAARAAAVAEREAAVKATQDAQAARAAAESERQKAQEQVLVADAARATALAQQQAAERDARQAREVAAKAEQDRVELRNRLELQLNAVLETKQTARGLIVNMSDVLFDVDKDTLKPGAREKLAKVSGIVMAHPDLVLKAEGHTDSTGGDDHNMSLSKRRAQTVQNFLIQQGIKPTAITSEGFGKTRPVATNDNAAGRQQNRRVELVISGDAIASSSSSTP